MHTPLNASATTAGALMSSSTFEIPPYQREYSWQDEVSEFWNDLKHELGDEPYFLGLVILTEENGKKQVVDGQQRILTLTLLAAALYHEALKGGRKALAERIQSDFLRSIDYETDETKPRVILSDSADDATLQEILDTGEIPQELGDGPESFSSRMRDSYSFLINNLRKDLSRDPFKRLGYWTDFLTNHLYFAVFVHPDSASAYRVFEVINTRGRELTTADLLKNYVLSQTPPNMKEERYKEWQNISRQFSSSGANSFVQYIRHVVTANGGHILPKDLYDFISRRQTSTTRIPPSVEQLMEHLRSNLSLYLQMMDPSLDGPADADSLAIFSSFNSLGVMSIRPILLSLQNTPRNTEGMHEILKLVVRRIVVGNLGTGNIERKFGEAAYNIMRNKEWETTLEDLRDLNPEREEFLEQLRKRSFNKTTLTFLRRSVILESTTPEAQGFLHYIFPRQRNEWTDLSEDDASFWFNTLGNTILAHPERRPKGANNWEGFKKNLLPHAIDEEWKARLLEFEKWDADDVSNVGRELAEVACNVWY